MSTTRNEYNGGSHLVHESTPGQVRHRLEFVVDEQLRRHEDEPKHIHACTCGCVCVCVHMCVCVCVVRGTSMEVSSLGAFEHEKNVKHQRLIAVQLSPSHSGTFCEGCKCPAVPAPVGRVHERVRGKRQGNRRKGLKHGRQQAHTHAREERQEGTDVTPMGGLSVNASVHVVACSCACVSVSVCLCVCMCVCVCLCVCV